MLKKIFRFLFLFAGMFVFGLAAHYAAQSRILTMLLCGGLTVLGVGFFYYAGLNGAFEGLSDELALKKARQKARDEGYRAGHSAGRNSVS